MKQKRKHIFKKLLIFGIAILLASCSEDLYDEEPNQNKYSLEKVPFSKLKKDKNFNMSFQKSLGLSFNDKLENNYFTSKYESNYIIVDSMAYVASGDNVVSYNFRIEYPSKVALDTIYNLVVENKSAQNPEYFITKNMKVNEILVPVEIANSNNWSRYTMFDCIILHASPRDFPECTMSIDWDCVDSAGSNDGNGDSGGGNGNGGLGNGNGGLGNGNGGLGNGNGGLGNGSDNSGGSVLVSPIGGNGGSNVQTFPDTPCGRMQKKSNSTIFKQKFKDLNKNSNFNKTFETGYFEKADGSFNFMTGSTTKRTLKFEQGTTSFMHIHMNNYVTVDDDGNEVMNYTIKMLSPGDIGSLIGAASNSIVGGLSPYDAYGLMLSNEGIFSVNLTDINVAMSKELKDQMDKEYKKRSEKIFKDTSANSLNRKKALQKMLLTLLKENGFGDKVALFEGEVEQEPGQLPKINWIKKNLDTNGILIETPC